MKPRGANNTIKFLLEWGTALGFQTNENYLNPELGTTSDVAWYFNIKQRPIFTFVIETDHPLRLTEKMLQWASTSTEPESWMHIGILETDAAKKPVVINLPPRMRVFNGDHREILKEEVEELVRLATQLLRRYYKVEDEQPSIKLISKVMKDWPKGQLNTRVVLNASSVTLGDGVYAFAVETEEDEEMQELVLTPSRKVVPVDISVGAYVFDGVLIRLTNSTRDVTVFSSEHRNLPFTFLFNIKGGNTGSVNLWFDADKSNPPQALLFWELVKAAQKFGCLKLKGSVGEVASFTINQDLSNSRYKNNG
jgi:hypothetical protein